MTNSRLYQFTWVKFDRSLSKTSCILGIAAFLRTLLNEPQKLAIMKSFSFSLLTTLLFCQIMVLAQRPVMQLRTEPEELVNPSEVLQARVIQVSGDQLQGCHGEHVERAPARINTRGLQRTQLWNSADLRNTNISAVAAPDMGVALAMRTTSFCTAPVVSSDFQDFAASVKVSMPFFFPYKHSKVGIWQGWQYNNGNMHNAIDFGKSGVQNGEDPAFGVYAVANGKVTEVYWSNSGGNIVKIEHTAPNGQKYRSIYLHLRNGLTHDVNKAKNIPVADPNDAGARDVKYKKYAQKANPDPLFWGTESQKLKVSAGQNVQAGQMIAYAGNSGFGGAGWGLDSDGTLADCCENSKNVHLHFEMEILHEGSWVKIDPFGVYAKSSGNTGCYELGATSPFPRFFAPFYPSFHNVGSDKVANYWGYYTDMGMGLQTLSLHRDGGSVKASGAFSWQAPKPFYFRMYMTSAQFDQYFNEYHGKGYRPRQLDVTYDSNGNPRYTVIWTKRQGEGYYTYYGLDDAAFGQKWDQHVKQQKMRVEDHVTYMAGGKRRHAVIFTSKGSGFYCYYGMSSAAFNAKFDELHKQNWMLVSMHAFENGNSKTFGGVWQPRNKAYAAYYGLSPAQYQAKFNALSAQGYSLHKIQGYNNSDAFAAVWMK